MALLRKLLLVAIVPMMIAGGITATTLASQPEGKIEICHLASSHKYVKISVSEHAVPAHLAHGDVLPDEYSQCP